MCRPGGRGREGAAASAPKSVTYKGDEFLLAVLNEYLEGREYPEERGRRGLGWGTRPEGTGGGG